MPHTSDRYDSNHARDDPLADGSSCSASSNYVTGRRGTTEMSAVNDFPDFTPQTANAVPGKPGTAFVVVYGLSRGAA
ncbi:hypothetical protein BO226_16730 [Rhodococcus sp. 2G]|nr:hypothetical protein BO226_16730 [Rhodococcus sp. 2G]